MRSWGGHYATRAVVETADLAIYQVTRPARGCLSYAVASEGRALVIDPLRHLVPYLQLARTKGFVIDAALDTHGHADHFSGGPALAAAMGQQVSMYFTLWGLSVLKKSTGLKGKSFFQKAMAVMSPGSSKTLPVSKMNYFGVGAKMLRTMMKQRNATSLADMIRLASELGVRMIACEMSRDVMGIESSELQDGLECGGVATFLASSLKSRTSLFISSGEAVPLENPSCASREPRLRWPRRSLSVALQAPIRGQPEAKLDLSVHHHAGRRYLPFVTLKRAA